MTTLQLKTLKHLRIISQSLFFGLFIYIFIRSLDPFSITQNPFLRTDPLIYLTHLRFHWTNLLPVIGIVITATIIGRFFCGWVCPLGSLIDFLDLISRPVRRINPLSAWFERLKRKSVNAPLSWFILAVVVITVFFTPPLLQFFHPNVWIIRIFSLSALGIAFLGLLFIFSFSSKRFWCSILCPLGALYGLFGKISVFRLAIVQCSRCGRCDTCPMGPLISIRKQFRTTSAFSALTLNTIAPCPVSP